MARISMRLREFVAILGVALLLANCGGEAREPSVESASESSRVMPRKENAPLREARVEVKETLKPDILLEAEPEPASRDQKDPALLVYGGKVIRHQGADYVAARKHDVVVAKKGKGQTSVTFRYDLNPKVSEGDYAFYARYMCGGDPRVSGQTVLVKAGPDGDGLDERAKIVLTNHAPWEMRWIKAAKPLSMRSGDAVLEITVSGSAQDAKTFDAFKLSVDHLGAAEAEAIVPESNAPKPEGAEVKAADFPMVGTVGRPVIALGLGLVPFGRDKPDPAVWLYSGKISVKENVDSASIARNEVTVARKGLAESGVTFQYELMPPIPPGYYSFQARYMCGGEPSQSRQTFTVKAGPNERNLGVRGTFQTTNSVAFKHQWVPGAGVLAIYPGDTILEVVNSGRAHDSKTFSGFVLRPESAVESWMTAERALLRSRFLASCQQVDAPKRRLYVVDGDGPGDRVLFPGLAHDSAKASLDATHVEHVMGAKADELARTLNLPARPAAVVVNGDRRVVGVLSDPKSVEQVAEFLREPGRVGMIPSRLDPKPTPTALVKGSPTHWLVATGWPGRCGVGDWGLDAERLQRPNPGDVFAHAYYTAAPRSGRWEERPTGANGVCRITDKLEDSFAWGKGTSYAVAYIEAVKPVKVVLHVQHSGIQSTVFLDGVEQWLQADKAPTFTMVRHASDRPVDVVQRPGHEIHDDVTVPQSAQGPLMATLDLSAGWHCLILKLVHAQPKDETVLFASQLTGTDGKPLDDLRSRTSDPRVPLGAAKAAAGLWPRLTLEGVPGNLARPGERLTLVADLRVAERSFIAKWLPSIFLPLSATLRVTMTDYDGKELGVYETQGTFPDAVKLDLGKASGPGFYSLIPELCAPDGTLIHRFHPDGFSVVLGNMAQKQRVDKKELWLSYYYTFNDWEHNSAWLERTGLFQGMGSHPGLSKDAEAKWKDAQARGIVLWGDFAGDSSWMNNNEPIAQQIVEVVPKYTRFFKGRNEIDGSATNPAEWPTANPEQWVKRAKWQYEALRKARSDAFFVSGSLYCSGVQRSVPSGALSPRDWFRRCLELGWDKYVDAWDVHAYPQSPPRLEAPSVPGSRNATDQGVLSVFKELGKVNTKPFILGETSALPWHGFTGLRWQAETVAKMAAWTNSRQDWLGVALCAAHYDRRVVGAGYGMARNPGEAAIYTVSALIDGLPYRRVPTEDPQVQAAYFGETLMVWRADDKDASWTVPLDGAKPWVLVDVVGRVQPLEIKGGKVALSIGKSPVYALTRADYERLTR